MNKERNKKIGKLIALLFMMLFVIPILTATLSVRFPLADYIEEYRISHKASDSYEGTKYSFFFVEDPQQAQTDFEDIAHYFENVDWMSEVIYPVARVAANPGEAAALLEQELHINLSDFNVDINQVYQNTKTK